MGEGCAAGRKIGGRRCAAGWERAGRLGLIDDGCAAEWEEQDCWVGERWTPRLC